MRTTVTVRSESSNEMAIQQVKIEEKQRGLGVIPNFFEVYGPNPAPLSAVSAAVSIGRCNTRRK